MQKSPLLLLCSILFLIYSCQSDNTQEETSSLDRVVIHIDTEPQRLNPILGVSGYETMVTEHMFLSLADFDPVTGAFVPVLLTDIPEKQLSTGEDGQAIMTFDLEILSDAVWADGSPIDGYDFATTMKLILMPNIATSWRSILPGIISIDINESDPKKFSVSLASDYFQAMEGLLTAEIYPQHVYDPSDVLGAYSYADFKSQDLESLVSSDEGLKSLGEQFSSVDFSRTAIIEGAGPYTLNTWETGQFIVLKRKENWWGDQYDRKLLKANPAQIVYQIISDETVAATQLRSGDFDFMSLSKAASQVYEDLKADPAVSSQYEFYTPSLPRIYFIMMNNQDPRLADVNVRKALASVMDVDRLIKQYEGGYGQRVNSPVHPNSADNNKDIPMVEYDVDRANTLLSESGWIDKDGDGIREKAVNGVNQELNLRFFISGSGLSESISNILKDGASQVGINVEIITKGGRASRAENIIPGDYEFTAQAITSEGRWDPHGSWHSTMTGTNGRNWSGYVSDRADALITTIRTTTDEVERQKAYNQLQELMAADQPMILLYAPVERFAISRRLDPLVSSKRPGFFVNAFELNNSQG